MVSMRIFLAIIAILFLLSFQACSGIKNPIEPGKASDPTPNSIKDNTGGRDFVAVYDAVIDPDAKTLAVVPERSNAYHFPLSQLFPDVLQVTGYGWTPNFWVDIKIKHPLPGSGIDGFDPRVIAIIPASASHYFNYPTMGVFGNGDVVLNGDGYTKLFDNLGGSMSGNVNPFKAYFKSQPLRIWYSTDTTEETLRWQLNLSGFGGNPLFKLVVDVSSHYPNPSLPIYDNAPEPVEINAIIGDDLTSDGGTTSVNVTLIDWQGGEGIGGAAVEAPQLYNGVVQLNYDGPGPLDFEYLFSGQISNTLLAPKGTYNLMIAAWDLGTGIALYKRFPVHVRSNHPEIIKTVSFGDNYHLHDVSVGDQFAYVTYDDPNNPLDSGLKIVDVYPPELAAPVSTYYTTTAPVAMESENNYVYLKTAGTFRIIRVWPPIMPYAVKIINTYYQIADMKIGCGNAYLPWVSGDMDIYSIEPPETAAYVGSFMTTGVEGVCAEGYGNYAFEGTNNTLGGPSDMYIADVTDPTTPLQVATVSFPEKPRHIDAIDGFAYVCSDYLYIVDIGTPASAHIIKSVTDYKPEDIFVLNGYSYMITGRKLVIVDIDPPESAYVKETIDLPNIPSDVYVSGNYAYVTINTAGNNHGFLCIVRL